ncbi:MAG: rRNA (cytidine-2'-O-)-methyltransferase, partial [Fervidobacterium sp.]
YELIDTLVFFESPERLGKTLQDIMNILGNCEIFIARELTKIYEESFFGKVKDAIERFKQTKGELTVIVRITDAINKNKTESGE